MSEYDVLYQHETVEIRRYTPQKRTIRSGMQDYFLQMPYMIFARRKDGYGNFLYVAFGKEDDQTVYFPSLGNIQGDSWALCAGRDGGNDEFTMDEEFSFDEMITNFWMSGFATPNPSCFVEAYKALRRNFGGAYKNWQKMSLEEVLLAIRYKPTPLHDFIQIVKTRHTPKEIMSLYTAECRIGGDLAPEDFPRLDEQQELEDQRYRLAVELLDKAGPEVSPEDARRVLEAVRRAHMRQEGWQALNQARQGYANINDPPGEPEQQGHYDPMEEGRRNLNRLNDLLDEEVW
jgi:hypothetical protein